MEREIRRDREREIRREIRRDRRVNACIAVYDDGVSSQEKCFMACFPTFSHFLSLPSKWHKNG